MTNDFVPIRTVIEEILVETPTIKTFVLRPDREIVFRSGQFMQLGVPGLGAERRS